MDIGPRIKLARAKAQMSLRELAEKVGVTPMAISKFERGEAAPRQSTLLRLARALSVNAEYFFREVKVETLAPAYRKKSKLGQKAQEAIEATIIDVVERYLAVEQIFPEEQDAPRLPRFEMDTVDDAEGVAERLRKLWDLGLGPIEDLSGRLEDHGVKVIALDGPEGFDGFSFWANGQVPVIAFNRQAPGDRQRFSLAHELGHLVMVMSPSIDAEKAAHRFAGALLVPAKSAYSELGRNRTNLSFDELLLLKREYRMSIQAWTRRAADLNIIGQPTYRSLYLRLSMMGWRTVEPDGVPQEEPRRLALLVHHALAENLITPAYAEALLGEAASRKMLHAGTLAEPSSDVVREYSENGELTASVGADLDDYDD